MRILLISKFDSSRVGCHSKPMTQIFHWIAWSGRSKAFSCIHQCRELTLQSSQDLRIHSQHLLFADFVHLLPSIAEASSKLGSSWSAFISDTMLDMPLEIESLCRVSSLSNANLIGQAFTASQTPPKHSRKQQQLAHGQFWLDISKTAAQHSCRISELKWEPRLWTHYGWLGPYLLHKGVLHWMQLTLRPGHALNSSLYISCKHQGK